MKSKKTQLLLLFFFCSLLNLYAQTVPPDKNQVSAAIDKEYEKLLRKDKVVGASIAVVEGGKVVYANGFGYSDLANVKKVTPNTIMPIGSATKTFTALAVMQLYEKGLLDIHQSIKKYIPELTIKSRFKDGNEIFIKDIMAHVSGLPSDVMNGMMINGTLEEEWVINELNKQTTISPRRFIDSYSNVGYALLGELIERVSGLSYEAYLKKNVFEPLEMYNTQAAVNPLMSKGYQRKKEVPFSKSRDKAAGVITSTALDMINFLKMLLADGQFKGERIISEKSLGEMRTDQMKGILLESSESYGYGMSVFHFQLIENNKTRIELGHGHSGYSPPFHAEFRYLPNMDLGVMVMSNTDQSGRVRSAGTLLDVYLREAKGIDYQLVSKESAILSNCSEEDIPGVYNMGDAVIKVKDLRKIKFKVSGTRIVLKRMGASFDYSITAKLFGFIPIKVNDEYLRFVKKEDQIYLIQADRDRKSEHYLSAKTNIQKIPNSWKAAYGEYIVSNGFESDFPEFDFKNAKVDIKEKDGLVFLHIKTTGGSFPFILKVVSDEVAYTAGIGRQMNYMVKILKNGNVYFSGFEFKKI